MNNLQSYLQKSPLPEVPWVTPFDSTMNALKKMQEGRSGAVLVRENSQIVGLFSEYDCIHWLIQRGASTLVSSVADVMTTKVFYATLDHQLEDCLKIMIQKQIRHLPIFSNENLLGFLNMETVAAALIDQKNFTITQLTHYITGSTLCDTNSEDCPENVRELPRIQASREYCRLAV